jgi:pyrroloquinoline quinone biosynthesis protein B
VLLAAIAILTTQQQPQWELVVLGVAQDAGFPHLGCQKPCCVEKRKGKPERVSCVGVRNTVTGESYLFDATPDIAAQVQELNGGKKPTGVFLSHAHMGHYTGLMYFGRESADWKDVPVYGTKRMGEFLKTNNPWKFLIENKNIALKEIDPNQTTVLADDLTVQCFTVPHRDEFTDTVGYHIATANKSVIFIPDIDRWEKWTTDIKGLANIADILLLDGTFSSPEEVGARDITQIPHPMIPATRKLLEGTKAQLWFIHLNHTNPAYGDKDVVEQGQVFPL